MPPGWTASLLGCIWPICSLVAPCHAGATPLFPLWCDATSHHGPLKTQPGYCLGFRTVASADSGDSVPLLNF